MNAKDLIGKKVSLLLREADDVGYRVDGILDQEEGHLCLVDDTIGLRLYIADHWYSKFQAVSKAGIFWHKNVDYVLSVRIPPIPANVEPADFFCTLFKKDESTRNRNA